jgi:hypothetical protein
MQRIQLDLEHQTLYRPVMGDLILSEESYAPYAATVFT